MLLESYLNESSSYLVENVDPINRPQYDGTSFGIGLINNESAEVEAKLDEAVLFAESIAFIHECKGNHEQAMLLQEGIVTDFFAKIVEVIKKMWAKVKAWFESLFKNIYASTMSITKVISKYKSEILKKDGSDFKYQGYKWNESNMGEKLGENLLKGIDADMATTKNTTDSYKDSNNIDNDAMKKSNRTGEVEESKFTPEQAYGMLITGGQAELSSSEAEEKIEETFRSEKTAEEIKGFSVVSLDAMIKFVQGFKDNKTLNNMKKKADAAYSKAIKSVENIRKLVDAQKVKHTTEDDKMKKGYSNLSQKYKNVASGMTKILAGYNTLMGFCIKFEKEKYEEYKGVIVKFTKYNPKKEK